MFFVDSFKFAGVDMMQLPCIVSNGKPTTSTPGAVGLLYMDKFTGNLYKCIAVSSRGATWVPISAEDHSVRTDYFQITEDGVLSLKPEYRGAAAKNTYPDAISDNDVGVAGSKNGELPSYLVIPEVVNEVAVASLATGMFYGNKAIKYVTLPKTITKIPESCFNECHVEEVHNIEQVTYVSANAFRNSNIKSAWMPNLTALGGTAFCQCSMLTHVHIGKVVTIHVDTFYKCRYLSRIESDGLITAIGSTALMNTNRLVNANIAVEKLNSIGNGAFIATGWDADWSKLPTSCTKGTNSIWTQYNPTDFWSACTPTACKNPLPTLLTQWDARWKNNPLTINGKQYTWGVGCQMFCYLHIYCGLNNLHLSHVDEFAAIVGTERMNTFENNNGNVKPFLEGLGLTVTEYTEFNQANLQALYDALARGAYAIVCTSDGNTINKLSGHAIVVYGATADGRLHIADSDYRYCNDRTVGVTYTVPYKTVCQPVHTHSKTDVTFCIVEKV